MMTENIVRGYEQSSTVAGIELHGCVTRLGIRCKRIALVLTIHQYSRFFSLQNRENPSFVRVKPGIPVPMVFLPLPDPTCQTVTHTRPDPRVRVYLRVRVDPQIPDKNAQLSVSIVCEPEKSKV